MDLPGTVLIVEDDVALRSALRRYLSRLGATTLEAGSCAEAVSTLAEHAEIAAILADISLPDGLGFELVDHVASRPTPPGVILMTGDNGLDNAIVALQHGATDFLLKPFSFDALDAALTRATRALPPAADVTGPEHTSADEWRRSFAPGMLGNDPKLLRVFQTLASVADTDCSVLVTGETGTGKELVARALHMASNRTGHPFVTVNCAAIPDNLLESELFGHARGAFTGALQARQGRFTQADGVRAPDMAAIKALPTITPSASRATWAACAGVEMPKPTQIGLVVSSRSCRTPSRTLLGNCLRAPVVPVTET